jgi:hypothetical protein
MKAISLREAITAALPDFSTDPDRLAMWITKGAIRGSTSANRGFEWGYTLNIVLQEFEGDPTILFLVINDWLCINQPELLQPGGHKGYRHEVDVLTGNAVDIEVQLDLTERTAVTANGDGTDTLQQLDDAAFLLDDEAPIGGPLASVTTNPA